MAKQTTKKVKSPSKRKQSPKHEWTSHSITIARAPERVLPARDLLPVVDWR